MDEQALLTAIQAQILELQSLQEMYATKIATLEKKYRADYETAMENTERSLRVAEFAEKEVNSWQAVSEVLYFKVAYGLELPYYKEIMEKMNKHVNGQPEV